MDAAITARMIEIANNDPRTPALLRDVHRVAVQKGMTAEETQRGRDIAFMLIITSNTEATATLAEYYWRKFRAEAGLPA